MIIEIGRDQTTSKLRITVDGKSELTGKANVPQSVGIRHCLIETEDDVIKLTNIDINNNTYVNGRAIEKKTISQTDKIELGSDHYLLVWKYLENLIPPIADIKPLKKIWENYEEQSISLQIKERQFNTLRSVTGLITMAAITLSIASGGRSRWLIFLYVTAIVVSLLFFIKAYYDAAKLPQRRKELNKVFQHNYVCPKCRRFLGNQSYDILLQNTNCPYCKTRFIH